MKNKNVKDVSASIAARLLNLARSTGSDFQELAIRYAVECFLARLAESEHQDQFILKDAMLYIPWKLDDKRTTMDLDLLGFTSSNMESLKQIFRQIIDVEINNDGLFFDKDHLTITKIREDSIYDGVRVIMRFFLGTMSIRLQVDVGFGDTVVPAPKSTEFPALLAEHGPIVRMYSPETVIAEKFKAMVVLGMANSRMKDSYDIWMLSRNFTFEVDMLKEAIEQTFSKRCTEVPENEPTALSTDFSNNESKQHQWKGFNQKQKKLELVPCLSEIIEIHRTFLMPIVSGINKGVLDVNVWLSERGWSFNKQDYS